VFCAQAGREGALEHDADALARLREQHDEITFIGGEPSIDARLLAAVERARELGFVAIGLQTNAGATLHRNLRDLAKAGLSDLHLSIHGHVAEAHDYHTGRPGSFDACLDLISLAQRGKLTVVVTTVVTRSNFRELGKLVPLLKRHGVEGWLIEVVRPFGRAADNFSRVVPRFGMALPWALHALEQARRHALSAWIRGAPVCALGPFAAAALPDSARAYAKPCEACPARPHCVGVDAAYLEVFGASELRPVPAVEPGTFDAGRRRLIRMFVGVGELVERPPQLVSPPSESAGKNRRLPVISDAGTDPTNSDTVEPGQGPE
jgi:MoaA/NifB/PqqE/SkfB family radical SAM enzyme